MFLYHGSCSKYNAGDIDIAMGKASPGVSAITRFLDQTLILIQLYSIMNASLCIDEFNEIYMVANYRLK